MNKNILFYEAPTAKTLVVRFNGCLCTSGLRGVNSTSHTEYVIGINDDPEEL